MAAIKDIQMPLARLHHRGLDRASSRAAFPSIGLAGGIDEFRDRRRRRRVQLQPMYTFASVRVLSKRDGPLEGHVSNLSETGMVVELDNALPIGLAITVEFVISGLGRMRGDEWPTHAIAAEVIRIDDLEDFPQGPYKTALRFVRTSSMVQAQIARFVATQPVKQPH